MSKSKAEDYLVLLLKNDGFPEFRREHIFHPTRKWRFDIAFIEIKLAIEVEGGVYSGGRHVRGAGYEGDICKYNEAAILGWTVLRFSTNQIKKETARVLDTIERARCAITNISNGGQVDGEV